MATALKGLDNNRIYCFLHYSQLNNIRLFILFNTRKSYICSIRKVTLNEFRCDLAIYIYKTKNNTNFNFLIFFFLNDTVYHHKLCDRLVALGTPAVHKGWVQTSQL